MAGDAGVADAANGERYADIEYYYALHYMSPA